MSPPPVVRSSIVKRETSTSSHSNNPNHLNSNPQTDTLEAWEEHEWEERSPDTALSQHMIAGSIAGMVEHAAVFPLDSIKTHMQATIAESTAVSGSTKPRTGWTQVAQDLIRIRGPLFLWRGVTVTLGAVVPAHAFMFAAYEGVLHYGEAHGVQNADASKARVACVGLLAGGISTLFHDVIMVPAETIKQRMQLGYYRDTSHATRRMVASGGMSLFRSLPTTLAMNVPQASLMVMSNETLRRLLNPTGSFSLPTFLTAGAVSGALAAAATTPLDVVKTRLQTQGMNRAKTSTGELHSAPREFKVRYNGFEDAFRAVYRTEGAAGFFRGVGPRILQAGPSCALSWCAYESAKQALRDLW